MSAKRGETYSSVVSFLRRRFRFDMLKTSSHDEQTGLVSVKLNDEVIDLKHPPSSEIEFKISGCLKATAAHQSTNLLTGT